MRKLLQRFILRGILPSRSKKASNLSEDENHSLGSERGADWYDESFRRAPHWRRHYSESGYYPLWSVIADRMERYGVTSVLDIGCGPGQMAALLRDSGVAHYVGIDFSPERISHAKKVCPEYEFVLADVFECDLLSEHTYDCVVCTEFLEHVHDDIEMLKRLKKNTRFLGSVPNFPYESHVRHFVSADQILERYSSSFENLKVKVFVANAQGKKYFLLDGQIR